AEDRILECYIRNLPAPPSPLIEPYLREANFSHVAVVGRGCKLDSALVSALVERWRPETHTFHIPYSRCTITQEDMQLQLWLLVDGSVVIGFVQAADWRGACCKLLGLVPETIYRGRIKTSWFRRNFEGLDEDSTEVERERHARAYILQIIGGILMLDRSRNLVHPMWLLKLVNFREAGELNWGFAMLAILYWRCVERRNHRKLKLMVAFYYCNHEHGIGFHFYVLEWNHGPSYVGLPNELRDIRLLLDKQSKMEHVKVSLVVYVTVEMHESNRVLQQFGFRQSIPVAPQYLDDLHHIDLRERTNENWPMFYAQFINIWNNRYDFLPTHEAIIVPELTCVL
ncbi:hypothetical protein Golax_017943, partial [Gossypium laxum]|nr:hypothetical protein [Gossypium laxum]